MTYIDRRIDHLTEQLLTARPCRCARCRAGTQHANRAFESGFTPMPADGSVGTPAGNITLPDWGGWGAGVGLYDLLKVANRVDLLAARDRVGKRRPSDDLLNAAWQAATRRASAMPSSLKTYFRPGTRLYRISAKGSGRQALDIGMTDSGTVGFRVMAHFVPRARRSTLAKWNSKGRALQTRIGGSGGYAIQADGTVSLPTSLKKYQVHIGRFTSPMTWKRKPDIRYVHVYEIMLQRKETQQIYHRMQGNRLFDD